MIYKSRCHGEVWHKPVIHEIEVRPGPRGLITKKRQKEKMITFGAGAISSSGEAVNVRDVVPPHRITGLHAIVDVLQNGVHSTSLPPPATAAPPPADRDPRDSFEEGERRLSFLSQATLEELNSLSIPEWESMLYEFDTGFDSFLWNSNVRAMDEDHVIEILEVMKSKRQRFFELTYYPVLSLSRRIQDWVSENMKPDYNNELFIDDKENY